MIKAARKTFQFIRAIQNLKGGETDVMGIPHFAITT